MQLQATLAVANYLIGKAHSEGDRITVMKLLKLVYIAHGWSLGLTGKPLIGEEVQAWRYGPVIPSVYQDFRHYKGNPIERQKAVIIDGGKYFIPTVTDETARRLLDKVWDEYKKYSGLQLSTLTHQPGTPWDIVWRKSGGDSGWRDTVIEPEAIAQYYRRLAQAES